MSGKYLISEVENENMHETSRRIYSLAISPLIIRARGARFIVGARAHSTVGDSGSASLRRFRLSRAIGRLSKFTKPPLSMPLAKRHAMPRR